MELATVLAGTDALGHLEEAHAAAWEVADVELLGWCRARMAMLLGHEPALADLSADERAALAAWPGSDRFDPIQRAALAFTEQYTVDVAAVTDAQVAALRDRWGDAGLVDFVNALLVVEQRMRLEMIWDAVL